MTKYARARGYRDKHHVPQWANSGAYTHNLRRAGTSHDHRLPSPTKSLVDALLPSALDDAVSAIAAAKFIDDGSTEVQVSPVDELLLCLTRRILTDVALGGTAVVQLPRAQHRSALLLTICAHLLCRHERSILPGPVIFIGRDVDVARQLRSLTVEKRHRVGLAAGNPLSAHRLTGSGELRPLLGMRVDPVDSSLVYFNVRIGYPNLWCKYPLVVLDATSVVSPDARERALTWADQQAAAGIVIVGDIGDEGLTEVAAHRGEASVLLTVTNTEVQDLIAARGRSPATSNALSSMSVLWCTPPPVVLHGCDNASAEQALRKAAACLAAKPSGDLPPEVALLVRLFRAGWRLASRASDYRTACTYNTRPGEVPSLHQIDHLEVRAPGPWRHWETARWGSLKTAVRALWRILDEENPKLRKCWQVLDTLDRAGAQTILIRCHSRAAADALTWSLRNGDGTEAQAELWDRLSDKITITTFNARFPACSFDAQILASAPPRWQFSVLFGIEAKETHIITYGIEESMLRNQARHWAEGLTLRRAEAAMILGARRPDAVSVPILEGETLADPRVSELPELAGISLEDVLDMAEVTIDVPEPRSTAASRLVPTVHDAGECIPVHLNDGRIWWCINEGDKQAPVLTLGVAGHQYRPLGDLRPGDRVVVPAGDGVESVHARLLALRRSSDDIQQLDAILEQFRSAARQLLNSATTQREAIGQARGAGAEAADQLPAWARGTTIAPHNPHDVEAVFTAAQLPCPDLRLIYSIAKQLRSLKKTVGGFVEALAADRGEEVAGKLRKLIGPAADEILDEFVVAVVTGIGEPCTVPALMAGRVTR
jgi:hypothetical protein